MIYKMNIPISGAFYMDEPPVTIDDEFMEPSLELDVPEPVPLSGAELAEHEEEIQCAVRDKGGDKLFQNFHGYLRHRIRYADVSVRTEEGLLEGGIRIFVEGKLSESEKEVLNNYIWKQFVDGFGEQFSQKEIPVSGGCIRIQLKEPDVYEITEQKKYKITDKAHPNYPWLHRIQALVKVNESVPSGKLGGYVESEANLSQEESCWIHDNAICCEEAMVLQDAQIFDDACVRESALITGNATMFDASIAEGNCCVKSGEVKEYARIAGKAVIGESILDGVSPLIQGRSNVYGTVRGMVIVKDMVLPGQEIVNPTEDMFILENGRREVLVKKRELKPTKGYQNYQSKKKNEPER